MDNMWNNIQDVMKRMADIEKARELAISDSRNIIRMTKRVIHSIQIGNIDESEMSILKNTVSNSLGSLKNNPEMYYSGIMDDALMEFAEAVLLDSIVKGGPIPPCTELGMPERPWMLGLADCIGEMRRLLLTHLMNSEIDAAKVLFTQMEKISDWIMMFDVPDAILPIRRKQDIARSIMERTRTDITHATMMSKVCDLPGTSSVPDTEN